MVAIKGMEMPSGCKDCPLTYLDTGDDAYFGANERKCVFDDSCIDGMNERYDDCPLVEIGIDIGDKDECAIYEYKGAKACYIDGLMRKERIND